MWQATVSLFGGPHRLRDVNFSLTLFEHVLLSPFSRQEHLLTDARPAAPAARVIVIRGLLQNQGAGHTRGDGHALNREWMLVVSRVDGSIQRFMAGGVELIEPGEGEYVNTSTFLGTFLVHHSHCRMKILCDWCVTGRLERCVACNVKNM